MLSLICTQENDIHAEYVKQAIEDLGGQALFFERYNPEHHLSFSFKSGISDAWVTINNKKYSLVKDIKSILWRVKPHLPSEISGAESSVTDKFRFQEWRNTISSMEDFLPDEKCINTLSSRTLMSRKISQLKLAIKCGLTTPESAISNSSKDIEENLPTGDIIYKTLSSFVAGEKLIYTNKIDRQIIKKSHDEISLAPGIFQTLIEKKYELRVVVVGDEVFCAKVDSQKHEATKIDWRYDQNEHMFSSSSLSDFTSDNLLKFHKESGLTFATYDFIVDNNGQEIFLECNPCGQWLFVGDELGLPITRSLARQLL